MRIVNWNIECMNNWFVEGEDIHFRTEHRATGIRDVDALCSRAADVIQVLNPDILTIEEGPRDIRMLQLFVDEYLGKDSFRIFETVRGQGTASGGVGGGEGSSAYSREESRVFGREGSRAPDCGQEEKRIYALIKRDSRFEGAVVPDDDLTLELSHSWEAAVKGGGGFQTMGFSRPPLVLEGRVLGAAKESKRPAVKLGRPGADVDGGVNDGKGMTPKQGVAPRLVRVVCFHPKRKFAYNGQKMFRDSQTRAYFIEETLANRQGMEWEAWRLRRYLSDLLDLDPGYEIVVTGDLNDGPGIDYFSRRYQTLNVVDVLMGSILQPKNRFEHALLGQVGIKHDVSIYSSSADGMPTHGSPEHDLSELCYTAVYDDAIDEIQGRKLLLDHILVSPALAKRVTHAEICHEEYEAAADHKASLRQHHVSDHRPILLEFN